MWKVSQFTVVHSLEDRALPEYAIVFNTFTGACLTVRQVDWDMCISHLEDPAAAESAVAKAIIRLGELGILVPTQQDERRAYDAKFDAARYRPARLHPIFTLTTACNIGCTYCYEHGVAGETMSPQTVRGVCRWMERRITEDGYVDFYPVLFGGEPLLYPKLLLSLMEGCNDVCDWRGAKCVYTSSSNGMLMTRQLAQELAAHRLIHIQISLDGPRVYHDRRRIGKRGQPSFDAALRGIHTALEYMDVTVKVNFDRQNLNAIAALFDELVSDGLHQRIDVKLEAVAQQFAGSTVAHNPEYVIPPESPEMADAYHRLTLEARARDIRVFHGTAHTTPCMFTSDHGVIIGPDGSIYKCISLVGRTEYRVGSVLEDAYDAREYARQMSTVKRLDECFEEKCPYVPVCAGGCAYESIVRTGRYDLRFCTKRNLEAYHFNRQLIRNRQTLEKLGMRALSPEELRRSEITVRESSEASHPACSSCSTSGRSFVPLAALSGTER